nr:hypothetical protein [Rhodoferax sp. U2-2l]
MNLTKGYGANLRENIIDQPANILLLSPRRGMRHLFSKPHTGKSLKALCFGNLGLAFDAINLLFSGWVNTGCKGRSQPFVCVSGGFDADHWIGANGDLGPLAVETVRVTPGLCATGQHLNEKASAVR